MVLKKGIDAEMPAANTLYGIEDNRLRAALLRAADRRFRHKHIILTSKSVSMKYKYFNIFILSSQPHSV